MLSRANRATSCVLMWGADSCIPGITGTTGCLIRWRADRCMLGCHTAGSLLSGSQGADHRAAGVRSICMIKTDEDDGHVVTWILTKPKLINMLINILFTFNIRENHINVENFRKINSTMTVLDNVKNWISLLL